MKELSTYKPPEVFVRISALKSYSYDAIYDIMYDMMYDLIL